MLRRIPLNILLFAIAPVSISLFFCANRKDNLPDNFFEIFSKWFVDNDSRHENRITDYELEPETIDSIVDEIRKKTLFNDTSRTSSETFTNPGKGEYITGIYKPGEYSIRKSYPLLIYLHGGNGTVKTTKGEKAWKMFKPLSDSIDIFLCSPSANRVAPWWSADGMKMILRSLRYMSIHYPIDPQKIFLAGVSDGATGCYAAANCIPGPFAGFFAISGFGGMLERIGIQLKTENLMQRNIYNVNAGKDHLYPVKQVNAFIRQLKESGVPVMHKIYPDEKHGFDYREKEYPHILSYMEKWKKPQREGLSWNYIERLPNRSDNIVSIKPSGASASIRGYWDNDTLVIRQNGCASVSFTAGHRIVFVKPAGSKPEKIETVGNRTESILDIIKSRCFPAAGDIYEYRKVF